MLASSEVNNQQSLLSLEVDDEEYLYRVARGSRVIYVSIPSDSIVPATNRTDGEKVLRHLEKLPWWASKDWSTLKISIDDTDSMKATLDGFELHSVSPQIIRGLTLPYHNFVSLHQQAEWISHKVFRVTGDGHLGHCVCMYARFEWEVHGIEREIAIHQHLKRCDFKHGPHILGYVYENDENHVVGFIMENIKGRYAGVEDYDVCRETLQELHNHGIVHLVVNRFNILINTDGLPKLLDFETSNLLVDEANRAQAQAEQESLLSQLASTSILGRYE